MLHQLCKQCWIAEWWRKGVVGNIGAERTESIDNGSIFGACHEYSEYHAHTHSHNTHTGTTMFVRAGFSRAPEFAVCVRYRTLCTRCVFGYNLSLTNNATHQILLQHKSNVDLSKKHGFYYSTYIHTCLCTHVNSIRTHTKTIATSWKCQHTRFFSYPNAKAKRYIWPSASSYEDTFCK